MKSSIQSVKGIHPVLPEPSKIFSHIEEQCATVLASSGYQEIRLPTLEHTDLFAKSIGTETDIVQKEMFTFEDRGGDLLTLRPEGTAGCARAAVEHGLFQSDSRLWYNGSFFRRERPQKGRHRQFRQVGAEAYGMSGPAIDAEMITMTDRIWKCLGITSLRLKLNSLGSTQTQALYAQELSAWLEPRSKDLDEHAQRRLHSNPLRILDSKNPDTIALLADAPVISDYWDDDSKADFEQLQRLLKDSGIVFEYDPLLVRGLDYYTGMVFEWIDPQGAAQSTVCAGGRYDGLVERLGGKPTAAVGFALGVERLALVSDIQNPQPWEADIYFVAVDPRSVERMHALAFEVREQLPQLITLADCSNGSFKAQLRRADKSGAKLAILLGEDEVSNHNVSIKHLRGDVEQMTVPQSEMVSTITKNILGGSSS